MEFSIPTKEFTQSATKWQLDILKDFDSRTNRFFLINWHRRARKTTLALNILIKECLKNPNRRYAYITSTYTSAKSIVWRDPFMLRRYVPKELVVKMNESELFIEFVNGSILSIHGGDNPDSLRGINVHGVVIDEAPLCRRELWEEILRPIIAQDISRWAIFIFTPKGRNWIYEYWVKAQSNKEWKTYQLKAKESGIIPELELEKLSKELPQRIYSQEFEGSFNDNATSVFKNVDECMCGRLEDKRAGSTYVTGIDLAKTNDFTVLITICRETRAVVDYQRFNQLEWTLQKMKIIEIVRKYNSLCVVDSTGVGDPITEDLQRAGLSVMPYHITAQSKKDLVERLIIAIEQRLVTFPDIPTLTDELKSFSYDVSTLGNVRYSAPEGMHDDCVIGLALAVFGLKNYMYPKVERTFKRHIFQPEPENAGVGY